MQEPASKDGQLCSGVLTTSDLIFMVMAAAAPMAVVVALMPMAFAFGNGAGVPAVYLGSAIAILFLPPVMFASSPTYGMPAPFTLISRPVLERPAVWRRRI